MAKSQKIGRVHDTGCVAVTAVTGSQLDQNKKQKQKTRIKYIAHIFSGKLEKIKLLLQQLHTPVLPQPATLSGKKDCMCRVQAMIWNGLVCVLIG